MLSALRSAALGIGTVAFGGLLFTTPHWLKNWAFYGDPLYPILYRYLRVHPWTVDAAYHFEQLKETGLWRAKGTCLEKLGHLAKTLWSFSFEPHDWPTFHGTVPVFGSLFTLTILALPFLRGVRRIWVLAFAAHVGVAVWWSSSHQDRYLQAIVPWMAAATAATLAVIWRSHRFARFALLPLVALQLVWGGDVYFIPTHAILGQPPSKAVIDLLSTGYQKNYEDRFRPYGDIYAIGRTMPKGAKVLLHEIHGHVGIRADAVSDALPLQYGIDYGRLSSPRAMYDLYDGMGITHIVWGTRTSMKWDSIASDLVYHHFVTHHALEPRQFGGLTIARMPTTPPATHFTARVAFFGCNTTYASGLYELRDLTVPAGSHPKDKYPTPRIPEGTHERNAPQTLIDQSGFVVFEPCHAPLPPLTALFDHAVSRDTVELWIRKADADPRDQRAARNEDNM
jgi:hypothetical protein